MQLELCTIFGAEIHINDKYHFWHENAKDTFFGHFQALKSCNFCYYFLL